MPGKQSESSRTNAGGSAKSAIEPEVAAFEWDTSRESPQDWNRGERGDSMRSGSGRSLTSLGSKADTNSVAESTSSAMEVGKEAKEKKDKSSWVKTIGMRTLRLRKNKDSDKTQSRLSIASALGSLDRPGKSKNKKDKHGKGDDQQPQISGSSSSTTVGASHSNKPGEHVKDNDSIYSAASSKNGSTTRDIVGGSTSTNVAATAGENQDKQDPARFLGEGLLFKGKLIGVLEVSGPRGDRICQEALSELKMAVKAAGEHKQKITIHIALDGLRIRDEKTGDCLYHHQVHKISFIAQDLTDARAFGYIFGSPDTGHRFFGIKTEKSASQVVIAMRDLFQVVFDLKKKEIERAKQQLEMQQKFLATRAAETAPTSKTEPKFSIAETYIEGAGALGGASALSHHHSHPSAPAEVDLLNLEVELNSLQEGLDNIHTNLVDSVPFRGSTASISSDPMNPMPKLSTGSMASASNASNPTPVSSSALGDPFGDSFDPFDHSAANSTPNAFSGSSRFKVKAAGLNDAPPLSLTSHQQQQPPPPYSSSTTPLTFTSDPFAQIDPFPGPKYHGDGDFFSSDPFDSPSGQFSFAYPNDSTVSKISVGGGGIERIPESAHETSASNNKFTNDIGKEISTTGKKAAASFKDRHSDGWVASFEDNFVPESEFNGQSDDPSKTELDIFTDLDPLGTGRIKPFVDRKDFFQHLKNPPKKNLKDLGGTSENLTPHSSSSSLVADSTVINTSMSGLHSNEVTPPKLQLTDVNSVIPNSFSTNFTSTQINDSVEPLPLKTPPTSISSRSSSMRMRLHSENSRSESPPNYSPPPPPPIQTLHNFSSTSSIGSVGGGVGAATNSEYMSTGNQIPFLPPPSSILGTPPSSRFANKKSPQLLKQMTIAGSTANTATSSPKTLPRPSSGSRERKLTSDSQNSTCTDEIPNLTPPPRPPHSHTSNTLGKSVSLSTAVPRPSSGSDRLRNLSGMSSLSGVSIASSGMAPPEPPPRPLQTTTISSSLAQQMSPSLVSPPPPLPPKKQAFGSMQSSPLSIFQSKQQPLSEFGKSGSPQKIGGSANESSNDLPLPLPSRKSQFSSGSSHHATAGGRYSVPLPSMSPSTHRREHGGDVETPSKYTISVSSNNSPIVGGVSRNPPVIKLTMEQALHQVGSMSLGDLAGKLELPVDKLSTLTIQQLAEKLTLMDFEQKMEKKERDLSRYASASKIAKESHSISTGPAEGASSINAFQLGFDDDFSTASAPPDLGERERSSSRHHHHHSHHHHTSKQQREEYDKYAVFRELSVEDASGFSIIGNLGSSLKTSNFSVNSEDSEDLSRAMDRTLTGNNSSSERTIQADGTGESISKNKEESFATAMANTMDDITDTNLSDDDGKFPFDDDEDMSPSSNFNTKPTEWATFESNFDDQFATTSLVKAVDVDGNDGSPWDSEEGGDNSQRTPPAATSAQLSLASPAVSPQIHVASKESADRFDFEPFQKPSQPSIANYSLTEPVINPPVPPVPERRRPSKENGGCVPIVQPSSSQPLSPDLLRSPISNFQRQSSGSSKHSGKSIEEPSIGGGRGSDYSESGARPRHRRGSANDEDRWERERDTYNRRRSDRGENYGRSDSRDSYSSIPRAKYREGRGESEEEYLPPKTSGSGRRRGSNVRPSSSKRSSEREGEPEDEREEEEDTRSYASYHSNYSTTGHRRHRRYPQKYHHSSHYGTTGHRKRERDRVERPPGQAAGSGHSSLSPERYSHHESDFDSYDEANGGGGPAGPRKKEYYAREREYSERHHHRSRPSSGTGYNQSSVKRHSRESPRHPDPYYRDRYYRGERVRRKYDDEYDDGRELSEYSGDEEHYRGSRHGGHRRRHRGRDDYYRDREHPRHHHYYTNSPSWDSESGPEGAGEKSEKGHRPASAKYGTEHGSMSRYSPPIGSSSSRPNSGRRESGSSGKPTYPSQEQPQLSGNGHGQHVNKRSPSGNGGLGKMREYRFDDDFESDVFSGKTEIGEISGESKIADDGDEDSLNSGNRHTPTIKAETIIPIESKHSQPQSPFEDNFVMPPRSNGTGDDGADGESQEGTILADILSSGESGSMSGQKQSKHHAEQQNQIFFPTKFESEDGGEEEEGGAKGLTESPSKLQEFDGEDLCKETDDLEGDRENSSSPDLTYTPPTSANSLRGNFSVYSTKRLESIRSEEEKSNEDSVSEGALSNNATSNATSNMKKSDSFNIFQAPTQDPFADDDFFK